MRAYSMDLRVRVLAAVDAGDTTAEVAEAFTVSPAWARRLVQRRRQTGEVAPRTARDPRVPKLRGHLPRIRELLAATPDMTLAELRDELRVAVASYRRSAELDPKSASLHNSLGAALARKGDLDGALASFRRATEIDPGYAKAQANLGNALMRRGDPDGAAASYRKALEIDPKLAPVRTQLAQAERVMAVGDKLPAFLKGSYTPGSNTERLDLAGWCHVKKLHHAGARVFAAAFAADPGLAEDLQAGHRYNAACSAALAAAGRGEDAAKLDEKERVHWRKQALEWLRADLTLWAKQFESGRPADRDAVVKALTHWQKDPDLAGIRDAALLAKLPEDEQKALAQLWTDVAAVLTKAEESGNAGPPAPNPRERK